MAKKSEYERGFKDGQKSLRVTFRGPGIDYPTSIYEVGATFTYTLPMEFELFAFGERACLNRKFEWTATIEEHCE